MIQCSGLQWELSLSGMNQTLILSPKSEQDIIHPKVRWRWNSVFFFHFCLIKLTFFFIANYLTSCLSTSAESVPESSPIKWSTVKPLSREQSLYFSPRRCILYNLLHPGWNVESLISPDEFPNFTPMSFDINLVILLRQYLVPGRVSPRLRKEILKRYLRTISACV